MASKTDLIVTEQITPTYWKAFMPGKEVLMEQGVTESHAIGRLWLSSAGDMIALFVELASNQQRQDDNTELLTRAYTILKALAHPFEPVGKYDVNKWLEDAAPHIQEALPLHQIGMNKDGVLFRCAICGEEWFFNPLMFKDNPDPTKRAIIFCSKRQ